MVWVARAALVGAIGCQAVCGQCTDGRPFADHRVGADYGTIDLARPGVEWPAWATYQHQPPVAHTIQGTQATLYAPAGAALLLRAETVISPLWFLPTAYLDAVLQTRAWIDSFVLDRS